MEILFVIAVVVVAISQAVWATTCVLERIDRKSKKMPAGRKAGEYEVEPWELEDVEN